MSEESEGSFSLSSENSHDAQAPQESKNKLKFDLRIKVC